MIDQLLNRVLGTDFHTPGMVENMLKGIAFPACYVVTAMKLIVEARRRLEGAQRAHWTRRAPRSAWAAGSRASCARAMQRIYKPTLRRLAAQR